MRGGYHHARTEGDPVEERTIAAGYRSENRRGELTPGHVFEFENVDQVNAWRNATGRLADEYRRAAEAIEAQGSIGIAR